MFAVCFACGEELLAAVSVHLAPKILSSHWSPPIRCLIVGAWRARIVGVTPASITRIASCMRLKGRSRSNVHHNFAASV